MKVVFPHPVGPTIAIFCPGFTSRLKCSISFLSGTYEKLTSFAPTLHFTPSSTSALGASGFSDSAEMKSNILSAQASAF